MAQVYRIMVRCPKTRGAIDTGIRTSGRDAMESSVYRDGKVSCGFCGQIHPFEGNAFVEPDRAARLSGELWRPNP